MAEAEAYQPKHPVRIVTAAALFDGHDAAINIMRRIMQATGAEVIHLGHNRSAEEIVNAAIQEDAQGVAVTSYQGGHMEFFPYVRQMLDERGGGHVRIYGGGGGVIVPAEIETLHQRGVDRIFSPDDGRALGLQGMINIVVEGCDFDVCALPVPDAGWLKLARAITRAELVAGQGDANAAAAGQGGHPARTGRPAPVVGLTGTGGSGKSSLTDELVRRFVNDFPDKRVAVLSVDPTRRRTGGALLGDRIRFNSLQNPRVYMRSMATRESQQELSRAILPALDACRAEGFDLIFVETAGIGQGDSAIAGIADLSVYVMTSEFGAPTQLEKIEMLDYADFVAINKYERRGSEDALRDVRKQFQRNRKLFEATPDALPIFGTCAAQFNDAGVNALYAHIIAALNEKLFLGWQSAQVAGGTRVTSIAQLIIPPQRERYLSEITGACRDYGAWARAQADLAAEADAVRRAIGILGGERRDDWIPYAEDFIAGSDSAALADLMEQFNRTLSRVDPACLRLLCDWPRWESNYAAPQFSYNVRGKTITVDNYRETLSGSQVRKVARPRFRDAGDRLYWRLLENAPGEFPFTAGVFPFKREFEEPTRMFAGEGPAERTNRRFHLLADAQQSKRLSTAFDSLTLYGEDPHTRPDIYGKIGESGVSIFTVEEAERLYAGFDLCDPLTSVSMTINGPAPTVLAFFMNAAIRQQCRKFLREQGRLDVTAEQVFMPDYLRRAQWDGVRALLSDDEYARIAEATLCQVRGTVQADILKEDQGQNTCVFSIDFALRMMGDVQQYFIDHNVRNYYSVSISGYHIAEAGANPIHQLAYTLANGFTYVEYYLARGMDIDAFAPNLSFFFSNGMDAEYSVIGRVARRIWAVALARKYGASVRSQMLKYHIQTSGRSLHAQEIQFNDIRTTLQALLATYDNAQSLHTNAYDEAITTPTEESSRRAMAIQLIINREFGLTFCENATQGSFIIEELTNLVEEAVLAEFDRLSERGGVLGAMERQYQRGAIQDDSMKYEHMKHSGELPIVGVNTFLPRDAAAAQTPRGIELTRASEEEKQGCLSRLADFQARHAAYAADALARLKQAALSGGNTFAELMHTVQYCSLGQISHALYEVGGEYRRNV
jgi:methylmalonyl-CoA mutase